MTDAEIMAAFFVSTSVSEFSMTQLLSLAFPFKITETNLRSGLSRMHAKGVIEINKAGRNAFYRLAAKGKTIRSNVGRHFKEPDWRAWDGSYWASAFSLPDSRVRYRLQKKLHAYRFRPLYPGIWIRPLNPDEHIPIVFQESVRDAVIDLCRCSFEKELTRERIAGLYGLKAIAVDLRNALHLIRKSMASSSSRTPETAFIEWIRTGDSLVHTLASDPLLPPPLLPWDWPAAELRRAFSEWATLFSEQSKPFVRRALNK